jgi:CBS domain-containing protein
MRPGQPALALDALLVRRLLDPAMTVADLRDVMRSAAPLSPSDSIARAIRLLRARGLPVLPVADDGRLVGMVAEADLLRIAAGAADPREVARTVPVGNVMSPIGFVAGERQSVREIANILQERSDPAVLVAAPDGRYVGILLPRDILAGVSGEPIVPPIAGLATPRGMYLTNGDIRAGVGDVALTGTRAALMII